MASTRVAFDNLRGQTLVGYLEQPDVGEPIGSAIFVHCFTCAPDLRAAAGIARALAGQGITTLRFDFTGLGQADRVSTSLADVLAAERWMHRNGHEVQLLVGHSLGGTACIAAASSIRSARAIAVIGAPIDAEHATSLFFSGRAEIEQKGEAVILLAGRKFAITKELADDLDARRIRDSVATLAVPLLVVHSPEDEIVGIDHAHELFGSAPDPRSFVAIDGADHLLTRERDYAFVADLLGAWSRRYVGA